MGKFENIFFNINICKMLINVLKATTMCMYVAHWNIFIYTKKVKKTVTLTVWGKIKQIIRQPHLN